MSPALISLLLQFGITYGPEAVNGIIAAFKKVEAGTATLADVEAAFTNLKPYSAYGINPPIIVQQTTG